MCAVALPTRPLSQRSTVAILQILIRHFLNWMRRTPGWVSLSFFDLPCSALAAVFGTPLGGLAAIARFRLKQLGRRPWTVIRAYQS
jgi:hypothetical protein